MHQWCETSAYSKKWSGIPDSSISSGHIRPRAPSPRLRGGDRSRGPLSRSDPPLGPCPLPDRVVSLSPRGVPAAGAASRRAPTSRPSRGGGPHLVKRRGGQPLAPHDEDEDGRGEGEGKVVDRGLGGGRGNSRAGRGSAAGYLLALRTCLVPVLPTQLSLSGERRAASLCLRNPSHPCAPARRFRHEAVLHNATCWGSGWGSGWGVPLSRGCSGGGLRAAPRRCNCQRQPASAGVGNALCSGARELAACLPSRALSALGKAARSPHCSPKDSQLKLLESIPPSLLVGDLSASSD